MYKIEKDVPVPPISHNQVGRPSKYPLHEMKVGESFCISPSDEGFVKTDVGGARHPVQNAASNHGKKYGKRFACRSMQDGGMRVWRVS